MFIYFYEPLMTRVKEFFDHNIEDITKMSSFLSNYMSWLNT